MIAMIARPAHAHQTLIQVVRQRLGQSPFIAVRNLACDTDGGVVILHGRVPTFYTKQMALALVRRLPGVEGIVDEIEVGPEEV